MKKKIYRTIIQYEILSDEPYHDENLDEIVFECYEGSWSGNLGKTKVLNQELRGKKAIKFIKEQGSDPAFFGMDDQGNEIEIQLNKTLNI